MQTKLVKIRRDGTDREVLREAGKIILNGGLVAFPTETVYGLGGDALNPKSSAKIYAAKGRPSDNPLIVHIAEWEAMEGITRYLPQTAKKLAEAFWPGPLTMVLFKNERVPMETTGGLETVAIRMPDDEEALFFIKESGGYVAAPSANVSGKPSPTLAKYVYEDMKGKIELILDGGQVGIGLESTIVDLTGDIPTILRPGYVTKEMLEKVIGATSIDRASIQGDVKEAPKAPGMKYKHYAPKGELRIIAGEEKEVINQINIYLVKDMQNGEKTGVIATDETVEKYHADSLKSVGKRQDEEMIARRLYQVLREFDEENVSKIYSEAFDDTGMGQAIMNRLLKAAGYCVENV